MRNFLSVFFALALSVSSAFAGGTISLMGIGPGQSVAPPIVYQYNGGFQNCTSGVSSCTYTNAPIGAAGNRTIVVVISRCTRATSSVTVGGAAATLIQRGSNTELWRYSLNTGTTATVVFNTGGGTCGPSIGTYSLYDLNSAVPIASNVATGTTSPTVSLASQAGGVVIAATYTSKVGSYAAGTCAPTGTQNYAAQYAPANFFEGGGCSDQSAGATENLTLTFTGTIAGSEILAASFH